MDVYLGSKLLSVSTGKIFMGSSDVIDLSDEFGSLKFSSVEKLKSFVSQLADSFEFGSNKTKYGLVKPFSDYTHTQGETFWSALTYYISIPEFIVEGVDQTADCYVSFMTDDGYGGTVCFAYFYYTFSKGNDIYSMLEVDNKLKLITDNSYTKSEIDIKNQAILDRIAVLETSVNNSTVNSNTKIDTTQFTELKSLLQGIAKVFMGVK